MGVVDEVTRAFHEANQCRHDHLRKAIGAFEGNLTDGDALEKGGFGSGRYPHKKRKVVNKRKVDKNWNYAQEEFLAAKPIGEEDRLKPGDIVMVKFRFEDGLSKYTEATVLHPGNGIDGVSINIYGASKAFPYTIPIEDVRIKKKVAHPKAKINPADAGKVRAADGPEAREIKDDED